MRILSFDTSTNEIHLSLVEDGGVVQELIVAEVDALTRQEAVAALMPSIVDLLGSAGWDKRDLGCIVVGEGPGSFTGVRTGVVTGRTIAQGLQLPLIAVSLLDCYASLCDLPAAVILSAGRGRYFVCGYLPEQHVNDLGARCAELEAGGTPAPPGLGQLARFETRPSEMERTHPACPDQNDESKGTFNTSVSPTSVSADELNDLLSNFSVWYCDPKAFSELQEHFAKNSIEPDMRAAGLKSLPILENIATKQAQIASDRLSLKLAEYSLASKLSGLSENGNGVLRDSLLQTFPYHSVMPLYLRSPSITLKKPATEKPHGS